MIGAIVDRVIIGEETHLFSKIIAALIVITVLRAIFAILKYSFDCSITKVIVNLRQDMFNHIQKLSFSYFDKTNTGELMSKLRMIQKIFYMPYHLG